jgi:hypothetical protein
MAFKWLMALGSQYTGNGCQVSADLLQLLGTTNLPTQHAQSLLSNHVDNEQVPVTAV